MQREELVDMLRGWALLGVTLMNYISFYHLGPENGNSNDTLTAVLQTVMKYLFSAKSWTLLSLLFGYGFSAMFHKTSRSETSPVIFFLRRMLWLLALGLLNSLFFYGDILVHYALLGILLLLFRHARLHTICWVGLGLFLSIPFISAYLHRLPAGFSSETGQLIPLFYSDRIIDIIRFNIRFTFYNEIINPQYLITVHLVMFLCMLTGMAAHRSGFFYKIKINPGIIIRYFWMMLALAILLNTCNQLLSLAKSGILNYFRISYWANLSTMLALGSGICWLNISGKLKKLFNYFRNMGRMTLTHYLAHCWLSTILFSGAGLQILNPGSYWCYLVIAFLIYATQLFISKWWLYRFNYGPVEWIWRRLTQGPGISRLKKTGDYSK